MTANQPTHVPGDKLKKALAMLTELKKKHPEKSRIKLLHEVELCFDLSPLECEFLNKNFSNDE